MVVSERGCQEVGPAIRSPGLGGRAPIRFTPWDPGAGMVWIYGVAMKGVAGTIGGVGPMEQAMSGEPTVAGLPRPLSARSVTWARNQGNVLTGDGLKVTGTPVRSTEKQGEYPISHGW